MALMLREGFVLYAFGNHEHLTGRQLYRPISELDCHLPIENDKLRIFPMVNNENPQPEVCLLLSASPYGSAATTRAGSVQGPPPTFSPSIRHPPALKTPRPSSDQTPAIGFQKAGEKSGLDLCAYAEVPKAPTTIIASRSIATPAPMVMIAHRPSSFPLSGEGPKGIGNDNHGGHEKDPAHRSSQLPQSESPRTIGGHSPHP